MNPIFGHQILYVSKALPLLKLPYLLLELVFVGYGEIDLEVVFSIYFLLLDEVYHEC
jgi:hypothetical protein